LGNKGYKSKNDVEVIISEYNLWKAEELSAQSEIQQYKIQEQKDAEKQAMRKEIEAEVRKELEEEMRKEMESKKDSL